MRKIVYSFIVFALLSLNSIEIGLSPCTPCCCQTASGSGQFRCYNSGECCLMNTNQEYWADSCYSFNVWVEPKHATFITGQKTPINLYIENTGAYTDNYEITYTNSDPNLVLVDFTGISREENVQPGEIRKVYPSPRITVLTSMLPGDVEINFIVTSDSGFTNNAILTIIESELPLSLPEFGLYGMSGMIISAGIIYFLIKRKH